MKMPLLNRMDPAALTGVVEAAAVAICQFNFASHDGTPIIIEGEPCHKRKLCDYCVTQASYIVHRIAKHQKENEDGK